MTMKIAKNLFAGSMVVASAFADVNHAQSQQQSVKNIVLVHGAFADGSSWGKVIPILEARGFHVVAVQNPMTSLADDVNATRRIVALQDGPVILVGHSWVVLLSQRPAMIRRWPDSSMFQPTFPTWVSQRTRPVRPSVRRQDKRRSKSMLKNSLRCRPMGFSTALQTDYRCRSVA